jgi:hypothetical protein
MTAAAVAAGRTPLELLPFVVEVLDAGTDGEAGVPIAVAEQAVAADGSWWARGTDAGFVARLDGAAPDAAGRCAVTLTVMNVGDAPRDAGLRVEVRLGPSADPGWLVPGVFYGENRPDGALRRYPRFTPGHVDVAAMESDAWSFRADRAATPAVFAWDDAGGAALVTTEVSALGTSGVGFAWRDGCPWLRLHLPYREEPLRYDGSQTPAPPDVRTHRFAPGETVRVAFALSLLDEDRHGYARVLRDVHAAAGPPAPDVAWVSVAQAAELTAYGLHRWHHRSDPPVLLETMGFDGEAFGRARAREAMHVSWVSGTPYAYALLRHGLRRENADYVQAAEGVLDHIAANRTPGGTLWAQWTAAEGWTTGWHPDRTRLHARTLGDATLFLGRAARLRPRPAWEEAVAANLDVACRTQRADGALPAAHDVRSGDASAWAGCAGLAWVAPLAESGDPRHLAAAQRAGAFFARHVEAGTLSGAPEDVDLAPTSEDGYVAVMAYMALHARDGDPRWLALAHRAADWTMTFRYSYDVAFSPRTLLGVYGFHTRGGDQASPTNQHLHTFGLIALREMVALARASGDDHLLQRTRENLACARQFVAREDGDFDAYRGMVSERYYQTDCFQAKGMLLPLSHAWSVGVLLLACEDALELEELRDA